MTLSIEPSLPAMSLNWLADDGKPLLLIHGWGMNAEVFSGFASDLARAGFRVGLLDLPGFGHSPAWPTLALEPLAGQLARQLSDAGIEPVAVLGWSLGGLVATELALNHPQCVSHLITVASSPRFVAEEGWPGIKPRVLSGFADALEQDVSTTLDRFIALQAMGSDSARQDIKLLRQRLAASPAPEPAALRDGLELLTTVDQRSRLVQLRCPWLRIEGRLDALVPAKEAAIRSQACGNSECMVLPKASHAPFISHPQPMLERLIEFVGG